MTSGDAWFPALAPSILHGGLDRLAIARERTRLREMSETELSDIGLSRREAAREAARPFWQGVRCP